MRVRQVLTIASMTLLLGAVFAGSALAGGPTGNAKPKKLKVTSGAFKNNQEIPASFTCQGAETSRR